MSGLLVAALILFAAPETRRIDDSARRYSFLLPGDYVEHSPGAWVRHGDEDDFVLISLESSRGLIEQDAPLSLLDRPGSTRLKEHWSAFELDGTRVVEERDGVRILVLAVQVPLSPRALRVMSSGLEQNEAQVHDALRTVLGSLEGRSSWLTEEERAAATRGRALRLGLVLSIIAGVGGWRLLRRRRSG